MTKALKDQAATLADSPSPFEARVVLEPDDGGSRAVLYEGNMNTAERVMTCWNVQLGVELRGIRRYQAIEGTSRRNDELRKVLKRMLNMHDLMMQRVDHGSSFYDAETIREMNEAPIEARRVLESEGW